MRELGQFYDPLAAQLEVEAVNRGGRAGRKGRGAGGGGLQAAQGPVQAADGLERDL